MMKLTPTRKGATAGRNTVGARTAAAAASGQEPGEPEEGTGVPGLLVASLLAVRIRFLDRFAGAPPPYLPE